MSRDNKGKTQETQQVNSNNTRAAADNQKMDTAAGAETGAIQGLEANPGFAPTDLASMKARNADVMGSTFGGAEEQLQRNAATQGHSADDAGLYPQVMALAQEKSRQENSQNLDYQRENAEQSLATRRAIPGMYAGVVSPYAQQSTALTGQNTGLITGRMSADNAPPFWQQAALAGIGDVKYSIPGGGSAGGGCWIAEAIWGTDDLRTIMVRRWLNEEFARTFFGKPVMIMYRLFGHRTAQMVKRFNILRYVIKPLFNLALKRSCGTFVPRRTHA